MYWGLYDEACKLLLVDDGREDGMKVEGVQMEGTDGGPFPSLP